MTSVNASIGLNHIDLENLADKSTSEIQEILIEAMQDMSIEEREEFLEQLPDTLGDIEESVFAKIEDIEDKIKDANNEWLEDKLKEEENEMDDLLELVDEFDELVSKANEEITETEEFFDREVTGSTTIDYAGRVSQGDEIVLTMADDTGDGIFEDEENSGLTVYNSTITIDLDEDQISLIGYDPTSEAATFSVTTTENINFHITINGLCNIAFKGQDYIDSNSLKNWPDELLQRCYDGNKNIFNNLNGFGNEVVVETTEEGQQFLDNFDSDINSINELLEQSYLYSNESEVSDAYREGLSSEMIQLIKETMLQILGSDLFIEGSDISIAEVWDDVKNQISSLSALDKNAFFGALSILVGKNAPETYSQIFTTDISSHFDEALNYLSTAPSDSDDGHNDMSADAFTIAATCVSEFYAEAAQYGGWEAYLASQPEYAENIVVLNFLKENFKDIAVDTVLAQTESDLDNDPTLYLDDMFFANFFQYLPTALSANIGYDRYGNLLPSEMYYGEIGWRYYKNGETGEISLEADPKNGFDDIIGNNKLHNTTQEALTKQVQGLFDEIMKINESGYVKTSDLRDIITNYLADDSIEFDNDDVLCLFLYTLNKVAPDTLSALCSDTDWTEEIWGKINNGSWVPGLAEDIKTLFEASGATCSEIYYGDK